MCKTPAEAVRREKRIRGFLETVEEIAAEAAKAAVKEEVALGRLEPGAIVPYRTLSELEEITRTVTTPPDPGKYLSPAQLDRMRAVRLLLKTGDSKNALDVLNDILGW